MNKTPPDFTKIFFDSLGGPPAAITYPVRRAGNTLHDVVFLSSLLHDARVLTPNAQPSNGRLDVRFSRDCWELGMRQTQSSAVLHVVDSVVTFTGVIAAEWKGGALSKAEPWLDHCWIDRQYRDHEAVEFTFSLIGDGWRCDIRLAMDDWSIEMRDQGVPHE